MIRPRPMSQCPYCGKVYDESDDPVCPYCDGFYGKGRRIRYSRRNNIITKAISKEV
jgi:rRNA maturation endonuclease Nob1